MTTRLVRVIRFRVTGFMEKSPEASSSNHRPVRHHLCAVNANFSLRFFQTRLLGENNTNTRVSSIDGTVRHDRIVDALNVTVYVCLPRFIFLGGRALLPFRFGPS
ncbi:hypothetical protein JHK82_014231 [Glycine max]|uniref:Uncharacterized protein n=2 Tax=Glycine subgen. Soja TaxID=1462606 RepID=A0A0R0JB99_SOYBN|nr:hypothetical protein JHK85_014607 [Glycine max]KAG5147350.1 hypothetical protein JHK82_014231 [Glycine max]RZC05543.1 hypothetical protein D0Y65_013598 [Glycine soja]